METKTCALCNIEKHNNKFYKNYSECKDCNRTRRLKPYYETKDRISNQPKICNENKRDKKLLQKQNNRCIQFRDLVPSYVELENKLKALDEKLKINDTEKH